MQRFIRSFGYAFSGITHAFKTQLNFKIHVTVLLLTCVAGFYYKLSVNEWLWIVAVSGLVFITELFNTSLEVLVDFVSPSFNEKAKAVKDIAASGVLIAAVVALISGLIIFIPKIS